MQRTGNDRKRKIHKGAGVSVGIGGERKERQESKREERWIESANE